jgi:predicted nucleic acid-binding protein
MPAKVADASVIAAIAFGEPRADEAEAELDGSDISAPTLLAYELTSVAVKKARLHPDRADPIERALLASMRLDIQWVEVDHGAALRLALDTGLTAYDASYLYLARALRMPLATFDERLKAAALAP